MNYVDNDKLLKEIVKFKETGEKSEELGKMFLLLATRYSEKGSFSGYTWKDDMIGEAVYTCLRYMHNFKVDKDKANPFAYFSKVVHNSFLNFIQKQKTHSNIKDICYKNLDILTQDFSGTSDMEYFNVFGIDYQPIRGKKKKKRKKKKTT
jgi:DNA-directed RNA polymerase specialized sigma24 family protein